MAPIEAKSPTSSYRETTASATKCDDEIWIFGYGSLIWKTNFPYSKKLPGFINGYKRRFWQGSTDHRGVPGKPGRVATLIEESQAQTWGIAFHVQKLHIPEVMAYLNHREKGGYSTHYVTFCPQDPSITAFQVLIYIATPDNEEYLGDASLDDIAYQIAVSSGPSGRNSEYLFRLAEAFRNLFPNVTDDHLFALEAKVKEFYITNEEGRKFSKMSKVTPPELTKITSDEN